MAATSDNDLSAEREEDTTGTEMGPREVESAMDNQQEEDTPGPAEHGLTDTSVLVEPKKPPTADPVAKSRRQSTSCKVQFLIFILLCILTGSLVISRSMFGVARFAVTENPCDDNNTTKHRYGGLIQKFTRPPYQKYFRFSQLLFSLLSFLHWLEYGYLFYGIFCFLKKKFDNDFKYDFMPMLSCYRCYDNKPIESDEEDVEKQKNMKNKNKNWCDTQKKILKTKLQPFIIILFFVFFLSCSVIPPIAEIINLSQKMARNKKCHLAQVSIHFAYNILTIVARMITVVVRFILVIATAMCGTIWLKGDENEENKETPRASRKNEETTSKQPQKDEGQTIPCTCTCSKHLEAVVAKVNKASEDREAAIVRFKDIMTDYEKRKAKVKPIYKIFRSWFIFQWVHYLFELSHHLVYLIRPWLRDETSFFNDQFLVKYLAVCLYDVLAIVASYLPALKMNAYLRRYIRKKQNKQKEEAEEKSDAQYAYAQGEFKIQTNPRSIHTRIHYV